MTRLLLDRLRRCVRREDGTATMEFLILAPLLFGFIVNSAEAGVVMLRASFLDWGLNKTVREMRMGSLTNDAGDFDPAKFRTRLCEEIWFLGDAETSCPARIRIEMRTFSPATVAAMSGEPDCIPGGDDVPPPAVFNPGGPTELTVVRVCAAVPPITPSFGIGAALTKNGDGDYLITAVSAYVSEPED